MLYRVDAVFQGDLHSLRALNMSRHLETELMRAVAGGFHELRRHSQDAGLADLLRVKHAAGDHQLYDVRLFLRDDVDIIRRLFRSRRLVSKRPCHMPAVHRNRHIRREDTRTEQFAGIDLVSHICIKIRNPANRADGGDAAQKLSFRVSRDKLSADAPCE